MIAPYFSKWWFIALIAWPLVLIVSSLTNMLVWGKFHWGEPFIMAPIAGILIGTAAWLSYEQVDNGFLRFLRGSFLILSHGLFGVLRLFGFFAEPAVFFRWSAIATMVVTLVAAAVDHGAVAMDPAGGGAVALSIPLFLIKAPFCLVSTAIGLLIFAIGAAIFSDEGTNRVGWVGGSPWEEYDRANTQEWATTLGSTFHCWQAPVEGVFKHELYHTRQCIYFHDIMYVMWVVGLIGQAAEGKPAGNPMEAVGYQIQPPPP
jgi:hypothetical protein